MAEVPESCEYTCNHQPPSNILHAGPLQRRTERPNHKHAKHDHEGGKGPTEHGSGFPGRSAQYCDSLAKEAKQEYPRDKDLNRSAVCTPGNVESHRRENRRCSIQRYRQRPSGTGWYIQPRPVCHLVTHLPRDVYLLGRIIYVALLKSSVSERTRLRDIEALCSTRSRYATRSDFGIYVLAY
jgi:hypothetical protein